ncbi:helix-turn-helix domain-containing protein [Roseinatronobacter sp.]
MKLQIRELRKNKGLNGETFAARVGCSKSYLSEIETGKKWPSGRLLKAFAKELGVSIHDLIDSDDTDAELAAHLAVLRDLSEADRRAVLRHAAGLLEQDVEQTT